LADGVIATVYQITEKENKLNTPLVLKEVLLFNLNILFCKNKKKLINEN
jgi:hypothetical protein